MIPESLPDPHARIAAIIESAPVISPDPSARDPATLNSNQTASAPLADDGTPLPNPPPQGGREQADVGGGDREDAPLDYDGDEAGPSDAGADPVDGEILADCAKLDHSDTDNGQRLIKHFGRDLIVLERESVRNIDYLAWTGTHWDMVGGNDTALRVAQKIGGRIALEADFLTALPHERDAIAAAEDAQPELDKLEARARDQWSDEDKGRARALNLLIEAGREARAALDKRKVARRKFGISSKNKARLEAMLACAAPHLTRKPDGFNADAYKFACQSHTISLRRTLVRDLECPDPDAERFTVDALVDAQAAHMRDDYITHLVPVAYDPAAACPKWEAFLNEFLPVESVRTCVQTFSGLGLLGLVVQYLVFHYGSGANGKSVFLETLTRVLGPLSIGLPAESISGMNERGGGQASPDIARCYGKRFLRVAELPKDKPLNEELVKKLTGGEKMPARGLFQAFFEFTPVFTPHMSGNDYPRIDGTDHGIWRRMVVIHWPVTVPDERKREFDDVLADFVDEYPGILNWLIKGACTFLCDGIVLPVEVRQATQTYRDEMDPISEFARDCVEAVARIDGQVQASVTAREMYEAYVSWSMANARRAFQETRFGKVMRAKYPRDDKRIRRYLDCRLHDVPPRPAETSRNPQGDG